MTKEGELASLVARCRAVIAPTFLDASPEVIERYEELLRPHLPKDYFVARIDPVPVVTLPDLFCSLGEVIGASTHPGMNWHAMRDRLLDFSWLPFKPSGFVLLYRHPELLGWADLSEFVTLADSVRGVYAPHRKPFKVLMARRLGS